MPSLSHPGYTEVSQPQPSPLKTKTPAQPLYSCTYVIYTYPPFIQTFL